MSKLPHSIVINIKDLPTDDLDFIISEYLSDNYEYCHYGFNYNIDDKGNIHITDILWATEEEEEE